MCVLCISENHDQEMRFLFAVTPYEFCSRTLVRRSSTLSFEARKKIYSHTKTKRDDWAIENDRQTDVRYTSYIGAGRKKSRGTGNKYSFYEKTSSN